MLKHLSKPGLGQGGYELVRRYGCLWELAWENTEYRNCWYAMPSISFMNCELLSGALTDNIVRACQHSSANVKGNWHVSTATFSLFLLPFFFCSQNRYDGGGRNVKLESGVKFHCVPTSKKITFFTHFERISPPHRSSVTWELIWTAVAMKGRGLLLCKPWKWSSHTVCLCALLALLPHLNVYSLTAHSFGNISLWSFSSFDSNADGKWLYQRKQGIGAGFGMQMVRGSQRSGMTLD